MKELIRITTGSQGESVVSARELHGFLESRQQFADWIKARIKQYGFKEGQDYVTVSENYETGGRSIEYALTLDMAKELSMVERTAKGKQARQYFIDSEKALRQVMISKPDQVAIEHAHRLATLEQQLRQMLEAQQQAARSLLELPRSTEALPEETTRIKIQRLVNGYCRAKGVGQQEVWRRIYDRLFYLYRISIRAHKRSERESWLDVAERKGYLDKLFAIASAELTYEEG